MTTIQKFLNTLRAERIFFFALNGHLYWNAQSQPRPEVLALVRELKAELLAHLTDAALESQCALMDPHEAIQLREERAAILEHEAGMHKLEAELRAGLHPKPYELGRTA